jgi:hypothetical protein
MNVSRDPWLLAQTVLDHERALELHGTCERCWIEPCAHGMRSCEDCFQRSIDAGDHLLDAERERGAP